MLELIIQQTSKPHNTMLKRIIYQVREWLYRDIDIARMKENFSRAFR